MAAVVQPYARILDRFNIQDIMQKIEYIARVSHRSEEAMTDTSWDKFLRSIVMGHGDLSVIEHVHVTVEAQVDRGITHEWVRHRIGNYTQESTRFVNYGKSEVRFIQPAFKNSDSEQVWLADIANTEGTYLKLLANGEPPELARSSLTTGIAAKIIVTYNLRGWRHFLIMRTTREAHPQMKQVTLPLLEEFNRTFPIFFEDIVPGMRQADAMRLLR